MRYNGPVLRRTTTDAQGTRARASGGVRDFLREKGILVLGHQDLDPHVARNLGLDVPLKGQCICARVVPAPEESEGRSVAVISGTAWVRAREGDPVVPAPVVPKR
ncbi:NaeI family type II restriction endonuclease [Kitasatospora sp. NPDC054795]